MANDWIIDVLADLKSYAEMNGMSATAASLEDATLVALAEAGSFEARGRTGPEPAIRPAGEEEVGKVTWLFSDTDPT